MISNYKVYINNKDENKVEAIPVGRFNFWAFFFTHIWALFGSLYGVFLMMVMFQVAASLISVGLRTSHGGAINLIGLVLALVIKIGYGWNANKWKAERLERIGYSHKATIKTTSESKAREQFAGTKCDNFDKKFIEAIS